MTLETRHLRLVPCSAESMLALVDGPAKFADCFGMPVAAGMHELLTSGDVSPEYLAQLRAAKGTDPWRFGFCLVDKEARLVVGAAGFKGPPDADGTVEIAYGVASEYQGRGYATEAAAALVEYAQESGQVRLVRAHTLSTNAASQRVLAKCGFTDVGEVVDPDDGLVRRWERAATSP